MRHLEITIPILLAVYLLWRHPRPFVNLTAAQLCIPACVDPPGCRGISLAMIPLYLLTTSLMISSLIKIRSASDWKPIASYLTSILLAVSTVLPILLPVPAIPAPDGPYKVGTRFYELTDPPVRSCTQAGRVSVPLPDTGLVPGKTSSRRSARPLDKSCRYLRSLCLTGYFGITAVFSRSPGAGQNTGIYKDSKVVSSKEKYPVILFSHGWNGFNGQNTGQACSLPVTDLSSLPCSIPMERCQVFDDGTIARNNPAALPSDAPDEGDRSGCRQVGQSVGRRLIICPGFKQTRRQFFQSVSSMNWISRGVGAYGHSTVGGAAIKFCGTDPRCKALLGQDPFMRPVSTEVLENGVTQPAFFMFSQAWADDANSLNNRLFKPFYANSTNAIGAISIDGTMYYDFSDLPLLLHSRPR